MAGGEKGVIKVSRARGGAGPVPEPGRARPPPLAVLLGLLLPAGCWGGVRGAVQQ